MTEQELIAALGYNPDEEEIPEERDEDETPEHDFDYYENSDDEYY